jgi:Fe-S cluster biogenesis protein NfuA
MRQEVEKVIGEIQGLLKADGGDIELLEVTTQGLVRVRVKGLCAECGGSMRTLRQGIERMIMEKVPGVRTVILG